VRTFIAILVLASATLVQAAPQDPSREMLAAYRKLEQHFNAPKNDPAMAFATLIVGCLAAYSGSVPQDEAFKAVVEQMRPKVDSLVMAKLPAADRDATIEKLAAIGMQMVVGRKQLDAHPDAKQDQALRETAAGYLRQFQLDPDALEVGADGLHAKAAAAKQTAAKPAATSPAKSEFAYEVEPGKGLKPSQIEAVVYSWDQDYIGTTFTMRQWSYLLLKDGTVRGAPPVAPDSLDAESEKRGDPKQWGQWKRKGDNYLLKWSYDKSFREPPNQNIRLPGKANERLSARYESSSSSSWGGGGTFSFWSIQFDSEGRFTRSSSGGGGTGYGSSVTVMTSYNDHGSATTISGPHVGGGTSRTTSGDASRVGTYHIDGYNLELRYDDGHVERRFFATDAHRKNVWFGAGEMHIAK
jgi:hypothetical protein